MNDSTIHPYTIEVFAKGDERNNYHWLIRRHGKLFQRSDRSVFSENKARQNALAQIERLLAGREDN